MGCKDKSKPNEDKTFIIKHQLFFSGKHPKWAGSGVAFINPQENTNEKTYGRMYLITFDQFLDVVRQENGLSMDTPITLSLDRLKNTKSINLFPDNLYGLLLCLGYEKGYPILSFTCHDINKMKPFTSAFGGYFDVIAQGLKESWHLTDNDIQKYMEEHFA